MAAADKLARWKVRPGRIERGSDVSDAFSGSVRTMLLADISALFDETGEDKLGSTRICQYLNTKESRPFPEYSQAKPLTPRQLARLLGDFGVAPRTIRLNAAATIKGYPRDAFKDAFARYLSAPALLSVTPSQPHAERDLVNASIRNNDCDVSDKSRINPECAPIRTVGAADGKPSPLTGPGENATAVVENSKAIPLDPANNPKLTAMESLVLRLTRFYHPRNYNATQSPRPLSSANPADCWRR